MAMAIVLLCCGLPAAWIAWQIASNPVALVEIHLDQFRLLLLIRTLVYNGISACVAVALALPVAIVLGRGRGVSSGALWGCLPILLLMPSMALAYGWQQFLRLTDLLPVPQSTGDLLRCIWTVSAWLWPIAAGVVGVSLRRLDVDVQQQAMLDGAYARVTARQLAPALLASVCIVMVLAVQEFSVYETTGISVVATEVRMVYETGGSSVPTALDWFLPDQRARSAAAVATAAPLIAIIVALSLAAGWLAGRLGGDASATHDAWPERLRASWRWHVGAWAVVLATVGVPIASLIMSLRRAFDPLRVWAEFGPALGGSIYLAALSGAVALLLGVLASVSRWRWMLYLSILTFLVGGQILAVAMIHLYNRPGLSWVYNGPAIVVMAHVARFGWIALLAGAVCWTRPWRELREIAAVDGAGGLRTALSVIWPLAWPVVLGAALLVMVLSLTEVPATVLVLPQRPQTIVPLLMSWVHMLRYDAMIEASLVLMGSVVALGTLAVLLVWLGLGRLGRPVAGVGLLLMAPLFSGCDDALAQSSRPSSIWAETGRGPGQVVYPRAIAYSAKDNTYFVVDRVARIQHLDARGQPIFEWRTPESAMGKPVGLTVGPDGLLYVPDTHYHRVLVYEPASGKLLRQWGTYGTGPGQFILPTDIAFDASGRVFVAEYGDNDRIQVFTRSGEFLFSFGSFGQGDGQFARPQSIVIHEDLVYVADSCNHRISVFTTRGQFIRNIGSVGREPGQFRFPYGLDIDSGGNLIVCEFGNNRVQRIDPRTGRSLGVWGVAGRGPGQLAYPWAVAVDGRDRIVVVDAGNNRLQVFRF